MELIYNGRKHKVYSRVKVPKAYTSEDEKGYVYFVKIGRDVYKIGTACDVMRRMIEHCNYYKKEVRILWISPRVSKYTSERVELKMKRIWKEFDGWEYMRNDRFLIPPNTERITITIRKNYEFSLE